MAGPPQRPARRPAARRPVVGVMGSGRDPHADRAHRVGIWLAQAGYHLLTGGGAGVMAAVTEAFVGVPDRAGQAIGILPGAPGGHPAPEAPVPGAAPPGYPNPWVEIAIRTHLDARGPHGGDAASRNHLNVLTSDVVIVLPGGDGTASEARLAIRYGRPAVAYLARRTDVPGLPDAISVETRFHRVQAFVRAACRRGGSPPAPLTR
ncbi:MAG: hypothetical protein OXH75_18370 [Acidobacteria bacterium]|nr:hypothetical protein [Acidobacteriota bacterium]